MIKSNSAAKVNLGTFSSGEVGSCNKTWASKWCQQQCHYCIVAFLIPSFDIASLLLALRLIFFIPALAHHDYERLVIWSLNRGCACFWQVCDYMGVAACIENLSQNKPSHQELSIISGCHTLPSSFCLPNCVGFCLSCSSAIMLTIIKHKSFESSCLQFYV